MGGKTAEEGTGDMKRIAFALFAILASSPALAQTPAVGPCGPYPAIGAALTDTFGEVPVVLGIATDKTHVVEWWANEDTGTWSILMHGSDGGACLVGSGDGFVEAPKNGEPLGDPS